MSNLNTFGDFTPAYSRGLIRSCLWLTRIECEEIARGDDGTEHKSAYRIEQRCFDYLHVDSPITYGT